MKVKLDVGWRQAGLAILAMVVCLLPVRAVRAQTVTYSYPGPLWPSGFAPQVQTTLSQNYTTTGCKDPSQDGSTNQSSPAAENVFAPFWYTRAFTPFGSAAYGGVSFSFGVAPSANPLTVVNGVSQGQGTVTQTQTSGSYPPTVGTVGYQGTYTITVSGHTVTDQYVLNVQALDLNTVINDKRTYKITSTYDVVSGIQNYSFALNINGTETGGPGCVVAYLITETGTVSVNWNTSSVVSNLSITTSSLQNGTVNMVYPSQTLTATGGTPPYTWSASGLPTGLVVNAQTGTISGTPKESSQFNVTAKVTDSVGNSASKDFSLIVDCSVTLPTGSLAQGSDPWGPKHYDHTAFYSTPFASALTTPVFGTSGAQTFTLMTDNGSFSVSVTNATNNLVGLVQSINAQKAGVTATTDFVKAKKKYRLKVQPPDDVQDLHLFVNGTDVLSERTIAKKGCALTSFCMALNYANASALPDGQPNLPDSLNNYMNTIKTAFAAEGGVNWVPASQAVGSKYQFVYAKIDSATGGTAAIEKVDSIVCDPNKPHPFIVGVQGSDKSQFPSHYVLVTGKKFDSNGNVTHPIADPANNNQTLEDYGHFQTRGYVKDPTDDLSGLSINAGNNVTILLTDPNGNKTGLDSDSHESDTIPLSAYYSDSLGDDVTGEAADGVDHFINVSRPAPGSYLLQVSGLSSGPYQVSIQVISTDGTLQQAATVSGQAHQGSITTYYLALSSNPGSSPTATAVIGDINGDGKVDCSDLAIVKASFGKSMNQSGFDPRADVNGDGIVNILDLSFVARQLPAGTVCE